MMKFEQINNSDKIIQEMFSDYEVHTTESDWLSMKESLANGAVASSTTTGSAGTTGTSIFAFTTKGIVLSILASVLIVGGVFYLTSNSLNADSAESLSLIDPQKKNQDIDQSTYDSKLTNQSNSSEMNTVKAKEDELQLAVNDRQPLKSDAKSSNIPLTSNYQSIGNRQNSDFSIINNEISTSAVATSDAVEEEKKADAVEEEYISEDRMFQNNSFGNDVNESYTQAKDILGLSEKISRTAVGIGLLSRMDINNVLFNNKDLLTHLPLLASKRKLKFSERLKTYFILGFRFRAVPYSLDTEYSSTGGINPIAHSTYGIALQYRMNNLFSLSTSVSHLRIIAPEFTYTSERFSTTTPITTLDWRYRRTVRDVYGLEIPLHLNFSPQSTFKLINNLVFTTGLTSIIPVYVRTRDEELKETIGSFSANRPDDWEEPSKFQGIKRFDLGLTLGIAFKSGYNMEYQLLYNHGFRNFVDEDFYDIDPIHNRNKNIQLHVKYLLF